MITTPPETPARAAALAANTWLASVEGLFVLGDNAMAISLLHDAVLPQLQAIAAASRDGRVLDHCVRVVGELKGLIGELHGGGTVDPGLLAGTFRLLEEIWDGGATGRRREGLDILHVEQACRFVLPPFLVARAVPLFKELYARPCDDHDQLLTALRHLVVIARGLREETIDDQR